MNESDLENYIAQLAAIRTDLLDCQLNSETGVEWSQKDLEEQNKLLADINEQLAIANAEICEVQGHQIIKNANSADNGLYSVCLLCGNLVKNDEFYLGDIVTGSQSKL